MAKKTPEQKATEYHQLALANYETWGHWVYETESVASLAASFAESGRTVAQEVKLAKRYADYADDVKATGDW